MQKLIWILGLWLVGIGAGYAATAPVAPVTAPTAAETLNFRVYWGFLRVGGAQISYVPTSNTYVLRAKVDDSSSLIDMHDTWETQGVHTATRAFVPKVYHVVQAENSYRADKTMTFDAKAGLVRYKNNRDASDVAAPVATGDARDVLSTIFAWRTGGIEEVQKAAETQIITLKKNMLLRRDAGVRTTLKLGNQEYKVWRVTMRTVKDGKPSADSWVVYLKDEPALTPVQIIAATKFGTFRATLDK